jgi:hypothetical protein
MYSLKRLVSKTLAAANSKVVKMSENVKSMGEKENVRASKIEGHGRKILRSAQAGLNLSPRKRRNESCIQYST